MSEPSTIKINEVEYVRKDSTQPAEGNIKIAILDRGFVYVGYVKEDGDFIILTHAQNIRKWGTSRGLGELVNGPLSGTICDATGTVRVRKSAHLFYIDVDQSKWTLR